MAVVLAEQDKKKINERTTHIPLNKRQDKLQLPKLGRYIGVCACVYTYTHTVYRLVFLIHRFGTC